MASGKTPTPPPVRSTGGGGTSKRTWVIVAVVVLVVAGIVIGLGIALSSSNNGNGGGGNDSSNTVDFSKVTGLQTGAPPWNNGGSYLADNLAAVHLSALTAEGTVIHIHQHLDVFVNGKHVDVPADIGIAPDGSFITEVHVHDTSGIIHVESPTQRTFTLGQLFGEWTVELNSNCVGTYCGSLQWWVNGKKQTGNPADLALAEHQEIVIASGTPPKQIPSTFDFAAHGV